MSDQARRGTELTQLAPAIAENQIQLTADIRLSKPIATERNLSARMKPSRQDRGQRRPTKAYPTALVQLILGHWDYLDFELHNSLLFAQAVKAFGIEAGLMLEVARGESLMVHGGSHEEPAPRLFVEYSRNVPGGVAGGVTGGVGGSG